MVIPRLITRQFEAIPRDSVPVNALVSEASR
jgi:hypothetical protein